MRLQNIRFPEADICREEELYFHRNGEWVDFNGYFNLFYIEKRKKYTNQESYDAAPGIEWLSGNSSDVG